MVNYIQKTHWSNDLGQSSLMHEIRTSGPGFIEFTDVIEGWVTSLNCLEGLVTLFVCHTSASLVIQENADPDVKYDFDEQFIRFCSKGAGIQT